MSYTVKPAYNDHPWEPQIVAGVKRWPLFRGFSIKIAIEFDLVGLSLANVHRSCCSEVAINTGLNVYET